MTLLIVNEGNCGIVVKLNGIDKGRYWGHIGPNTDARALCRAWLGNEGIQYHVRIALCCKDDTGYFIRADLER